jgi:DNA-binding response OmpR family regulator
MLSSIRPKVLCVDNDEDFREMLSMLLGLSRIEAKAVGTATQALSLIQAERFDLYTLDAWLPKVDGFELCRRMRNFDPHTPILFFSGAALEADRKRGIDAGANAYVIKPDIYRLVRSIKQFISFAESDPGQIIRAEREVNIPAFQRRNYPNFCVGYKR